MKTFLSIGSGPGMSVAAAERFAREGFQLVLSARRADRTQALASELNAKGYKTSVRIVDASDPSSIANLIADVEGSFGGIEVMHYNVATMRKATITDQSRETFNEDLAVNIGGALTAIQAAIPYMTERGSGAVLLTGGGYSLKPNPDYLSLSIGKAGIRALAYGLFESLSKNGIHVATVTVAASVEAGSKEAQAVAEHFWTLYRQPKGNWTAEVNYVP